MPLWCCFMLLFTGCTNDMETISMFNNRNLPSQELKGAEVRRSERGVLQMTLEAPLIQQYQTPEAKTVYPKGVELQFFDNQQQLRTTLRANYALSLDERNIMKAQDSVVVIDYQNGDTIYLEDIIWNSNEDRIYSNHSVRAVNGQRVTYGDGFVSDQQMQNLRILRQRGTVEVEE